MRNARRAKCNSAFRLAFLFARLLGAVNFCHMTSRLSAKYREIALVLIRS